MRCCDRLPGVSNCVTTVNRSFNSNERMNCLRINRNCNSRMYELQMEYVSFRPARCVRPCVLVVAFLCLSEATADSWLPATPIVASSPDTELVIRIEPAKGREPPLATYFGRAESPEVYSVMQRVELVNRSRPLDAFLGDSGVLVTLDEYGQPGHQNAIVVYGATGTKIQSFDLEQIYSSTALSKMSTTITMRHWRESPPELYDGALHLVDVFENAMSISLSDGSLKVWAWQPDLFVSNPQISITNLCGAPGNLRCDDF